MLMLILCTGLGSPPFPWTGGFGVDKDVSSNDVAQEADVTVQPRSNQGVILPASLQAE